MGEFQKGREEVEQGLQDIRDGETKADATADTTVESDATESTTTETSTE